MKHLLTAFNLLLTFSVIAQTSSAQLPELTLPSCISTNNITLTTTGGTLSAGDTTLYVLTDGNGQIISWDDMPTFQNLNAGTYIIYAMSYNTSEGVQQFAIGNNIQAVTSSCIDFSEPYGFNICPDVSDCSYYLGDDVTMDTTGGIISNASLQYILADSNGQIVQLSNTPVFTNMQTTGTFFAYALAVVNGVTINNLVVGNDIANVTFTNANLCYDWSTPFIFEVCFVENPSVTISKTAVDTIQAGNAIFYTFTIQNDGGTVLNNVTFTDVLNNNFEYLSNPIQTTNNLQVIGSSIHQNSANLTLNNVPIGASSFQLYVAVPINTTVTLFCNTAQLDGLVANNPNLNNSIQSNQVCTTIWKTEDCTDGIDNDLDGLIDCADDDCTLPAVGQIIRN